MEHARVEPEAQVTPRPAPSIHADLPERPRRTLLTIRTVATLVAGVLMLIGGFLLWHFLPSTWGLAAVADGEGRPPGTTLTRPRTAASPAAPRPGMTVTPTDLESVSKQMADLNRRVGELSTQVADLDRRIGQVARSEEDALGAEIKPLAERISTVSRKTEEMADLAGRVDKLEEWLEGVGMTVDEIRTAFVGLRERVAPLLPEQEGQVQQTGDGGQPGEGGQQAGQGGEAVDQALTEGVAFLASNQFSSALDVAGRVREARPDDARGWYLSALANGYVSSDWRGQTEQFVLRGVELERAGSPPSARIDATFQPLPEAVRAWLDAYRSRARAGTGR